MYINFLKTIKLLTKTFLINILIQQIDLQQLNQTDLWQNLHTFS